MTNCVGKHVSEYCTEEYCAIAQKKREIENKSFNVCDICKYDTQTLINKTNVKRKYFLTDKELNNANIYKQTFKYKFDNCTRYLRSDINKLAEDLTRDLPDNDRRKKAFIRQNNKYQQLQRNIIEQNDRFMNIKKFITSILHTIDQHKVINTYIIENEIYKIARDLTIPETDAIQKSMDNIQKVIDKLSSTGNLEILKQVQIKYKSNKDAIFYATLHIYKDTNTFRSHRMPVTIEKWYPFLCSNIEWMLEHYHQPKEKIDLLST
jgi:hypothetical protein